MIELAGLRAHQCLVFPLAYKTSRSPSEDYCSISYIKIPSQLMYLVLERVFLCVLLANIQQALQGIVTLQKIVLYRFARKSSFMGQGKNTLSIKTVLPAICDMKINNSCQKFLEERTNERSKKTYKKLPHWQPSLFTLWRAVRGLNTKDSNSQSDESLLCYAACILKLVYFDS